MGWSGGKVGRGSGVSRSFSGSPSRAFGVAAGSGFGRRRAVDVQQHRAGASGREKLRRRETDAAGPAGDGGHAAVEAEGVQRGCFFFHGVGIVCLESNRGISA